MSRPRLRLKNDVDQRMPRIMAGTHVFLPERDFQQLTRSNLDHWIAELRKGERMTRKLRERMEALRDQTERSCPVCGRPVTGRADAVYCEARCRIIAHRQAQKEGNG